MSKVESKYMIGDWVVFLVNAKPHNYGCIVNLYELLSPSRRHVDYNYVINTNTNGQLSNPCKDYVNVRGTEVEGYWFAVTEPPKSMIRGLRRELNLTICQQ